MYIADPLTAKSLHQAELIIAEERRVGRRTAPIARPSSTRRRLAGAMARLAQSKRPTPFDRDFLIVAGLSDRRLQEFESYFEVRPVESGDVLARQGDVVADFGLVLAGRVGVSIDDGVVAVLEPGTHYGALGLLHPVGNTCRKVTLHALEAAVVATATADRFHALMGEFPSVQQHVRNVVRRRRAYFATRAVSPDPIRYPVSVG